MAKEPRLPPSKRQSGTKPGTVYRELGVSSKPSTGFKPKPPPAPPPKKPG